MVKFNNMPTAEPTLSSFFLDPNFIILYFKTPADYKLISKF
jgi:hypothetical protein